MHGLSEVDGLQSVHDANNLVAALTAAFCNDEHPDDPAWDAEWCKKFGTDGTVPNIVA